MFAIPITDKQYIVAEFIAAPNDNAGLRAFMEQYSDLLVNNIMSSFFIEYAANNPAKSAVLADNGSSIRELIEEKKRMLEHQQ